MKTVRESTTLYNFLGSHNPYWRLTESSDVLRFSTTETTEPDRTLQLSAEQAARIREMTVITSSLMMSLTVDESDLSVHLVGRKINKREWAGNASAWHDTPAVARDLSHGLSFAEQVVSEAHSAIVILDSRGNIQRFNRLCEDYTGLKEHDVIGQSVFKLFMSRREAAASRRNNRVFFRSGNAYEVELVVSEAHSAIVILDSRGNIQRFNRLCEDYTGLKEHDVIGQSVFKLFMIRREAAASRRNNRVFFRGGNAYEVELWIPTRNGQRLFLFRNKFVHSGSGINEIFLICSGTYITEERRAQERLRILANTDSMTGVPNRNAMQELIDHAMNQADNNKVGVVYLDLDNFKKVNDAYGHLFGDQLLRDVSLAILCCLEHDQVLARPGGDECLVLASNTSQSALEAMASRILTLLRLPFRIGLIEVYTSCSICPQRQWQKRDFFNLFRHRHYRRAPRSGATAYSGKYRQYHRTAES